VLARGVNASIRRYIGADRHRSGKTTMLKCQFSSFINDKESLVKIEDADETKAPAAAM